MVVVGKGIDGDGAVLKDKKKSRLNTEEPEFPMSKSLIENEGE